MAILPSTGRKAIANAITKLPLHFAWGTGDGAWVTPTAEDPDAVALMNELGRRTATQWAFVVPDNNGTIDVSTGKFSPSPGNAKTRHIWVQGNFDFGEAPSAVIREIAVFSDTVVATGLPPGQQYFTPGQVTNPGVLLYVEHITPIFRSPAIQENFEAVISF